MNLLSTQQLQYEWWRLEILSKSLKRSSKCVQSSYTWIFSVHSSYNTNDDILKSCRIVQKEFQMSRKQFHTNTPCTMEFERGLQMSYKRLHISNFWYKWVEMSSTAVPIQILVFQNSFKRVPKQLQSKNFYLRTNPPSHCCLPLSGVVLSGKKISRGGALRLASRSGEQGYANRSMSSQQLQKLRGKT